MWQNSNTMPAYICNYGNNVLSNRIESGACGKKHFSLETGKYKIAIVGNCELRYLTQTSVQATFPLVLAKFNVRRIYVVLRETLKIRLDSFRLEVEKFQYLTVF